MNGARWLVGVVFIVGHLALPISRGATPPPSILISQKQPPESTDNAFLLMDLPFEKADWKNFDSAGGADALKSVGREIGAGLLNLQGLHCTIEEKSKKNPNILTVVQLEESGDLYRYHREEFQNGKSAAELLVACDGTSYQNFDYRVGMLTIAKPETAQPVLLNDESISTPFEFMAGGKISAKFPSLKDLQDWLKDSSWLNKISHLQIAKIDGNTYYRFTMKNCYDYYEQRPLDIQVTLDGQKSFFPVQLSFFDKGLLLTTMNVAPKEVSVSGIRIFIPDHILENYYRNAVGNVITDYSTTNSQGQIIPYGATSYTFTHCSFAPPSPEDFTIDPSIAQTIHDLSSDKYIKVPR